MPRQEKTHVFPLCYEFNNILKRFSFHSNNASLLCIFYKNRPEIFTHIQVAQTPPQTAHFCPLLAQTSKYPPQSGNCNVKREGAGALLLGFPLGETVTAWNSPLRGYTAEGVPSRAPQKALFQKPPRNPAYNTLIPTRRHGHGPRRSCRSTSCPPGKRPTGRRGRHRGTDSGRWP